MYLLEIILDYTCMLAAPAQGGANLMDHSCKDDPVVHASQYLT